MFGDLHRVMSVKGDRGSMSETNGITLLYELGDVGYGAIGWICKGFLRQSHPHYGSNVEAWHEKRLTLLALDEGEFAARKS